MKGIYKRKQYKKFIFGMAVLFVMGVVMTGCDLDKTAGSKREDNPVDMVQNGSTDPNVEDNTTENNLLDYLTGESFESYKDAKSYILEQFERDHANAHYTIKEDNRALVSYDETNPDAQGYQFDIYETDGNEKIGRYYVDKENGKIVRYMGQSELENYR